MGLNSKRLKHNTGGHEGGPLSPLTGLPLVVHDPNRLQEDLSPVFETGRCGHKDVTPSQQGRENGLKHSDGPFGRVRFALLGFEPDHFAESRHEGVELRHVFVTQGRLSVRVEDLDPFKAGGVQHFQEDALETVPGLVLECSDEHEIAEPVDA